MKQTEITQITETGAARQRWTALFLALSLIVTVLLFLPLQCGAITAAAGEAKENGEKKNEIVFEADSFSIYAIVYTAIEKTVLASDGETYRITVSCDEEDGIPGNAQLAVEEILPEPVNEGEFSPYEDYLHKTAEALGWESAAAQYARFFDIAIMDENGEKMQPAAGSTVNVKIELADKDSNDAAAANTQVVHFADGRETAEVIENTVEAETQGISVSFEAASFSVYAIVDAPEPVPSSGWNKVSTVEQIAELGSQGFYMRSWSGYYFMDTTYIPSNGRTGIEKTKPAATNPYEATGAVKYYFEPVEGANNQFRVYCMSDSQKLYIRQSGNSLTLMEGLQPDTSSATSTFTIDAFPDTDNTFRVQGKNNYYWNMQGGDSGNGFCAFNNEKDTNAKIQLEFYYEQPDDPYGLDGKSFGIAYHDESVTAASLTAGTKTSGAQQRLAATDLVIRPDVLDNEGVLLVSDEAEITEWTFESLGEDRYYLTTIVDGEKKYLMIDGASVSLSNEPDAEKSVIKATPGTGSYAGKWHFTVNGCSLNLNGSTFNAAAGSGSTTWMNLVEKSVLTEDDFTTYTAKKVSVSDTINVYDSQQVVIYTRIWNDSTKRYEFYAVDHDGSLIRCYDTGDGVEWVGTQVNTALWTFTEYRNSDGSLNYYYELQNFQYGNYIAPQASDGQILSDGTIGLNLNGRRYEQDYTTIIAWDDKQYSYSGLKTENGKVVACPLSEAEDFYFAIMNPIDVADQLTTVDTVDNDEYGITMKMIDYNNPIQNESGGSADSIKGRDSGQTAILGYNTNTPGLLSTDLNEDGYPVTIAGNTKKESVPLATLYDGATPVNHLFIESIYNESGYFEYDSTSNFAHLNDDRTFTVYDQLGAIGDYETPTGTHGQFMPYDDLTPGKYCLFSNRTNVLAAELADLDPRKGEKLYNIGTRTEIDYFFGMEMEASFTQTADGLDAWGHDIIFEFSGDDDFWFYVDGELVLDLGGVHSAMTGSINFRTGEVKSSRGNSTLYEIFKKNYQVRGLSDAEITTKLNEIFEQKTVDGKTVYVFRDYTNHTMKMFYMERGGGASNLHMRFNLAAVKPGTVVLSKKLSGTDSASNSLIEFPYQILYRQKADGGDAYHLLTETTEGNANVTYKDSSRSVTYRENLTIGGKTYNCVFFLKQGESAVIDLPDDTIDYYIVECGVNTAAYDVVKANGSELTGTPTEGNRSDYAVAAASPADRPEVDYDNHVSEGAMRTLSLTKQLYDTDGLTELTYPTNETLFSFRLYLGNEFTDEKDIPLANLYSYYVKNAKGEYCRWDSKQEQFVSLGIPKYEGENGLGAYLSALTATEKETIIFKTSMNGSITKIPAGYTIEVRDLIVGTKWKVEEWDNEVPRGYTRREGDGYVRTDLDNEYIYTDDGLVVLTPDSGTVAKPAADVMVIDQDPAVQVRNQKGWGITVEKVWTDQDFMESHDDIYFAVYLNDPKNEVDTDDTLVEGTVRSLKSGETELYYFFDDLRNKTDHTTTYKFDQFVIREVTLTKGPEFAVDQDTGAVTGYTNLTPIYQDGTLTTGGKSVGGEYQEDGFHYTVGYEVGDSTGKNENIRTDTVTNSRPGIKLYKTCWDFETPLSDTKFTLQDDEGKSVAAESYTSRESDGLITIAYLNPGVYTLTEIETPKGYVALEAPLKITIQDNGTIVVSGPDGMFTFTEATEAQAATETEDAKEAEMASITIQNCRVELKVKKIDATTEEVIPDVHFALYLQVTDAQGNKRKDYQPISGYEDIITDDNGILGALTLENLTWGQTYYLTETKSAEGYDTLPEDLCFTVGKDGKVNISTEAYREWLKESTAEDGLTAYTIEIRNSKMKKVQFKKTSSVSDCLLSGAVFDLYRGTEISAEKLIHAGLISDEDGYLFRKESDGEERIKMFELEPGTYILVETQAPAGYNPLSGAVTVTVAETADGSVIYAQPDHNGGKPKTAADAGTGDSPVYEVVIYNNPGVELPSAGGNGTVLFSVIGAILTLAAGAILNKRMRYTGC